jgi:hypothetical protein
LRVMVFIILLVYTKVYIFQDPPSAQADRLVLNRGVGHSLREQIAAGT